MLHDLSNASVATCKQDPSKSIPESASWADAGTIPPKLESTVIPVLANPPKAPVIEAEGESTPVGDHLKGDTTQAIQKSE